MPLVLVAVVRRLAGVVAVFAVVFAPAAGDLTSGSGSNEPAPTDLSGAVLAPTFASSELALGRFSEHTVDNDDRVEHAGYQPEDPDTPRHRTDGPVPTASETVGPGSAVAQGWSQRAPPAN